MSVPAVPVVPESILPLAGAAFVNVNVIVLDSCKNVVSAALVTVREHVPVSFAVTTPEVNVHFAVPVVTVEVVAPVPDPPVTAIMIPVYRSPVIVDTSRAAWSLRENVTVVAFDISTR